MTPAELLREAYRIQERINDAEMEREGILHRIRSGVRCGSDLLDNGRRIAELRGEALVFAHRVARETSDA